MAGELAFIGNLGNLLFKGVKIIAGLTNDALAVEENNIVNLVY